MEPNAPRTNRPTASRTSRPLGCMLTQYEALKKAQPTRRARATDTQPAPTSFAAHASSDTTPAIHLPLNLNALLCLTDENHLEEDPRDDCRRTRMGQAEAARQAALRHARPISVPAPGIAEAPVAARARVAHNKEVRRVQRDALLTWARDAGCLLDAAEFERRWQDFGELGGAEHDVIPAPEEGRWYKRAHVWPVHQDFSQYLARIQIQNALFPAAEVRFEGFFLHEDELRVAISQVDIEAAPDRLARTPEALRCMKPRGFRILPGEVFVNPQGVVVEDLHPGNILITPDARIVVIDPIIWLGALSND